MYKSFSITVIIPCLNEEQGIEQVLRRMPPPVDEVIVVDNGSTDRTSEVASALGAKVIREDVPQRLVARLRRDQLDARHVQDRPINQQPIRQVINDKHLCVDR